MSELGEEVLRKRRLAVVLFNLGGPDSMEAVEPFLKNLFSDPAILPMPGPVRALLARFISKKRAPVTREIYRKLGGKTPLLEMTEKQASALEKALVSADSESEIKVFTAMRYWHPRAREVVGAVKAWAPTQVVLMPLYPQYSTTTSQSSIDEWKREAVAQKLVVSTRAVCCYPVEKNFIAGHVALLQEALAQVPDGETPRILFSAHGLPKRIIDRGDPYQAQIEMSVAAVMASLGKALGGQTPDHVICYQSRVTKVEWIGPSTDQEILRAAVGGVPVVLTPIAFVSEHSETLVELDMEYRELAEETGVPLYIRVPTLGTRDEFVRSLTNIVLNLSRRPADFSISNLQGERLCGAGLTRCPCALDEPGVEGGMAHE